VDECRAPDNAHACFWGIGEDFHHLIQNTLTKSVQRYLMNPFIYLIRIRSVRRRVEPV
jgi:hypothetical protein